MADKKDKKGKNAPDVIRIEAGDETTEKKHVSAADKPLQSDKYLNDDFIKTVTGENNAALKAAEKQFKLYDDIIRKVTGENNTVLKAIQETWGNNNTAINRLQTDIAERTAAIAEAWKNGATQKAIEELTPALKQIQAYFNSEAYQIICKYNTVVLKKNTEIKENAEPGEEVELLPHSDFIGDVLSKYQERGELQEDISVAQIIKESYTETGERTDSNTYTELLKRAAERYTEYDKDPAAFEEKYEEERNLPAFTAMQTFNHYVTLTKATQELFNPQKSLNDLQQAVMEVRVSKEGAQELYCVHLDIQTAEGIKGTESLTPFDESVMNAAYSIEREQGFFTAPQVAARILYGRNTKDSNPSKQFIGAVTKSIEKCRLTIVRIDYTDHLKMNIKNKKQREQLEKCDIGNYVLPVRDMMIKSNGKTVKGYFKFQGVEFPLFKYALDTEQISNIDTCVLSMDINLDIEKIQIRDCLLKHVLHVSNNKNWNPELTIDTIIERVYKNAEITAKKRHIIVKTIKAILDKWKKIKFIKSYDVVKQGKTIYKIIIAA